MGVERKHREETRLSEKLLSDEYINSLPGLFYVFDEQRFVKWNKEWGRVTGYSDEELACMYGTDFFEGEDRTLVEERMLEVFSKGISKAEAKLVTKDGRRIPYYFTGVRKEFNGTPHLVGLGIDITDRKRLESQLNQAQKMEAVGQLAAGMAHDLNNAIMALQSYTFLALSSLPPDHKAVEMLDGIQQATDQMSGITKGLVAFSQKSPANMKLIDLGDVIKDTLHLMRHVLPTSIEVATDTQSEPPIWVQGDSTQLQLVIMNLMINAQDAMPNGGTLTISIARASTEVHPLANDAVGLRDHESVACVSITDTGVGMTRELREHIFEPFFTTKERTRGTGLGLATVHGIVKSHGGRVVVRSEVDRGTTFTIVLPVDKDHHLRPATETVPVIPRGNGELILLAEDSPNVNSLISDSLKSWDYKVISVLDGVTLEERFNEYRGRISLLIVDIDLPKRNGLQGVQAIRFNGDRTPVIFITGGLAIDLEDHLEDQTYLLRKPFSMSELGTLIDYLSNGEVLDPDRE